MNPIGKKGHVLCAFIGLLVFAASSLADHAPEDEVSSLKLKLDLLKKHYRHMCQIYTSLPSNCSAPVINCTECPEHWLQVGEQCFHVSADRHDFNTSSEKCAEHGAHLAVLTTREQYEAVEKEGKRIGGIYTYYWIGLTDIAHEGEWKWVDDSPVTVKHWDLLKNQPDNNKDSGLEGEDCAVVDSYTGEWNDVPCSFSYGRICQKDARPLV